MIADLYFPAECTSPPARIARLHRNNPHPRPLFRILRKSQRLQSGHPRRHAFHLVQNCPHRCRPLRRSIASQDMAEADEQFRMAGNQVRIFVFRRYMFRGVI